MKPCYITLFDKQYQVMLKNDEREVDLGYLFEQNDKEVMNIIIKYKPIIINIEEMNLPVSPERQFD